MKPGPGVLKSILLGLFHVIAVLWERASEWQTLLGKDTGADMLCFGADKREREELLQVRRAERFFWNKAEGGRYEVTCSDVGSLPQGNLQTVT